MLACALAVVATRTNPATAAPSTNFAAGSLIIPMDADTSANHASLNQNLGMWKAYRLVYKLLQTGIPVRWGIKETKTAITDVDISAASVRDRRTGTALGAWDYRGGPFIVDSADAARAQPIIAAWWAANGNQPNVHEAFTGFSADVNVTLRNAPRIANEVRRPTGRAPSASASSPRRRATTTTSSPARTTGHRRGEADLHRRAFVLDVAPLHRQLRGCVPPRLLQFAVLQRQRRRQARPDLRERGRWCS